MLTYGVFLNHSVLCVCVLANVCTNMWRPDVNIWGLPKSFSTVCVYVFADVCMNMQRHVDIWCLPKSLSTLFFETDPLTELGAC